MKRLICTLASLAMLFCACSAAQAQYYGLLLRNEPIAIQVDNSANALLAKASGTVYYLGNGKVLGAEFFTVDGGAVSNFHPSIPRSTRRMVLEVDLCVRSEGGRSPRRALYLSAGGRVPGGPQ